MKSLAILLLPANASISFCPLAKNTYLTASAIQDRNDTYCRYLIALGYLGLGEKEKAARKLQEILTTVPDHQGAIQHLILLNSL